MLTNKLPRSESGGLFYTVTLETGEATVMWNTEDDEFRSEIEPKYEVGNYFISEEEAWRVANEMNAVLSKSVMRRVSGDDKSAHLSAVYEELCEEYALQVCMLLGISRSDCWWSRNEVGGALMTSDFHVISMDEIRLLVDNDIPSKVYTEWYDKYISSNQNDQYPHLSLRKWIEEYKGHQ